MSKFYITNTLKVPLGQDVLQVKQDVAKLVGLNVNDIKSIALKKQSVDARNKSDVHFVCSYIVETDKTPKRNVTPYNPPVDLLDLVPKNAVNGHCIVVGSGPAGLFLARLLTENGVKVTVVERGSDVEQRKVAVQTYFDGGAFDENCNVQFGLGGAGTFSDGKLTTGISSPLLNTVFNEFVCCGAPSDILTSSLPHIGTDNLVNVVANIRDKIVACGGQFLFDTTVKELIIQNGKVCGVSVLHNGKTENIYGDCVALCCGHSARELFEELVNKGVETQFKPFAVGLRIEHKRKFINEAQYGKLFATHRDLSAASYKLANNVDERGCYSFCMCPGGVVVPANSQNNTVVVNGMSNYARDAENSNSAIVVSVGANDVERYGFGNSVLSGMNFQNKLEELAYKFGGGNFVAPCQNVTDFLSHKKSSAFDVTPSYSRGVTSCDFHDILPHDICNILEQSLHVFNTKIHGFAECGVLTGVETRTSSPIKVVRDEHMQSNIKALFPVGEGGGHAGGIVSSAVDGLKVAQCILEFLKELH